MSSAVTLKTVGDWYQEIDVPLSNALSAATEMLGKTGYKACEMAIVYMAKAAGKETKVSPKKREIVANPFLFNSQGKRMKRAKSAAKFGFYSYKNGEKVFNPMFSVADAPWIVYFNSATTGQPLVKNMKTGVVHRDTRSVKDGIELSKRALKNDPRLNIKNRGLGQRSWMWGLKGFSKGAIPGVTDVATITGPVQCGLVLTDRLNYITKAIPSNLLDTVHNKATNSIMAQVAMKVEKQFSTEIPLRASSRKRNIVARLEKEFAKSSKRGVLV